MFTTGGRGEGIGDEEGKEGMRERGTKKKGRKGREIVYK